MYWNEWIIERAKAQKGKMGKNYHRNQSNLEGVKSKGGHFS